MSFGGAVSSMITSLKNNKRTKSNTFKNLKSHKKGIYKKGTIDKKASPQQLKEIRERIRKENKRTFIKNTLIISFVLIVIIYFVWVKKH